MYKSIKSIFLKDQKLNYKTVDNGLKILRNIPIKKSHLLLANFN